MTSSQQSARLLPVICLDPGHPSENGIGTGGRRVTEVAAAWKVARLLEASLRGEGFRVVMTKSAQNQHVTNRARARAANESGAALMLRLHCDAAVGESGFATFYPDRAGTVGGVRGPSAVVLRRSKMAATAFHPAVIAALRGRLSDRGLRTDRQTFVGGRQGGALTGSIFSRVPVLLVEMGVLQSARDDALLASTDGQRLMADALLAGVRAALQALNGGGR